MTEITDTDVQKARIVAHEMTEVLMKHFPGASVENALHALYASGHLFAVVARGIGMDDAKIVDTLKEILSIRDLVEKGARA